MIVASLDRFGPISTPIHAEELLIFVAILKQMSLIMWGTPHYTKGQTEGGTYLDRLKIWSWLRIYIFCRFSEVSKYLSLQMFCENRGKTIFRFWWKNWFRALCCDFFHIWILFLALLQVRDRKNTNHKHYTERQTDGRAYIDLEFDADQKYVFTGSRKLASDRLAVANVLAKWI